MIRSREKFTLRKRIYLFFIIAGIMYILMPYVVHADVFGYNIQDVYQEITDEVKETNDILVSAFKLSEKSPFDIFSDIKKSDGTAAALATNIQSASQAVALVVATLLLMMDFFKKSITFEWSSRWENVLLFLIKIIVVKQIVQNTDVIITHVYALFNYINTQIAGKSSEPEFLPYGTTVQVTVTKTKDLIETVNIPYSMLKKIKDLITGANDKLVYHISPDAVNIFYPGATVEEKSFDFGVLGELIAPKNIYSATLERLFLTPYFIFMKIIAYFIFVIVIGRTFELCVYTILAPLPLCTYASESTQDIAKNFLKNYIACVLQMAVIATMFAVYVAMMKNFLDASSEFRGVKLLQIVMLAALALGVGRSGEWSRRLCGA